MQLSISQLQSSEPQKMHFSPADLSNQAILAQPAPIRLFSSSPGQCQDDPILSYLSASNSTQSQSEEISPGYDPQRVFISDICCAPSSMMGYHDMELCDTQPICSIDYENDRLHLISPLPLTIQLPQKHRKITRKASGPLKILIVEDDPLCQQLISHIIKSLHVGQCEVVADGVEAVINMSTNYFDLILMDMHLPHLDGLQATQNIRKFNRRTPIISMTARVGEEDVKRYFEGGIDEILPKPFDKQSVRRIIEQFFKLSVEE